MSENYPNHKNEELVKVKVLRPISQKVGPCLVYGMTAEFPKSIAEHFIASGDAEKFVGVDLQDAIRAVKAAGGEISCDADNAQLVRAIEAVAKADGGEVQDVLVDGELDDKSHAELKELAAEAGHEFPGNISKAKLVELLSNQE